MGEMTDEAAPAIRVFPACLETLALESVTERVRGLGTDALRKRRIGDHLVAAGVVALVERASHDLGEPAAQNDARGECGIPWAA